jgi:hypothetical protein
MDAGANGSVRAQGKARGAAQAGRLGKPCNAAMRPHRPVPFGLPPESPRAALRSLAGPTGPAAFRALLAGLLVATDPASVV